jgi:hypothetical protein
MNLHKVCDICGGTGVVPAIEYVYPGEPHTADIGEEPCECQLDNEHDDGE